jgi:hypothetical protein
MGAPLEPAREERDGLNEVEERFVRQIAPIEKMRTEMAEALALARQKGEALGMIGEENDAEIRVRIAQLESVTKTKPAATAEFMEAVVEDARADTEGEDPIQREDSVELSHS